MNRVHAIRRIRQKHPALKGGGLGLLAIFSCVVFASVATAQGFGGFEGGDGGNRVTEPAPGPVIYFDGYNQGGQTANGPSTLPRQLDKGAWNDCAPGDLMSQCGGNVNTAFDPGQITEDGDNVLLSSLSEPLNGKAYRSGHTDTENKFEVAFGRWNNRVKFAQGTGMHSEGDLVFNGDNTTVEAKFWTEGEFPGLIHLAVGGRQTVVFTDPLYRHFVDMDWTPTSATFYVDGIPRLTVTGAGVPQGQVFMSYSLTINKVELGAVDPAASTNTPDTGVFVIDTVKFFSNAFTQSPFGSVIVKQ